MSAQISVRALICFKESIFFVAEAATVLWWGRASDYFGRKPPLLLGTLILAASITSFGLSKSFGSLVVSRCIQGIANGNIGITKGIMGDISDGTNIAQCMRTCFKRFQLY
jgi:MFS family permease